MMFLICSLLSLATAVGGPGDATDNATTVASQSTPFVELAPLFDDGMVLQRNSDAPIWGAANPGVTVQIGASWLDRDLTGLVGENGRFSLSLPTPQASGPHALVVTSSDGAELVLRDIWVGEVWLASGQSNMEWTLGPDVGPGTNDWRAEVSSAQFPRIRAFRVEQQTAWRPREMAPNRGWVAVTPENAGSRSAVGYYFAKRLWEELQIPIGIIETSWGGTPVEAWTSADAQSADAGLASELQRLEEGGLDPAREITRARERQLAWWRELELQDPGARGRWMSSRIDERSWREVRVPSTYAEFGEGGYDGTVWYRRTFELPDDWLGQAVELSLGSIDDRDTTWVNGVRIGGHEELGQWQTPRFYSLPAALARSGKNVLAVRTLDTGGAGGFTGSADEMFLRRLDDATDERISLAGKWLWRKGASLFDLPPQPTGSWLNQDRPAALYNGMIAPFEGFGIAGFIWYQGESNRTQPVEYRERFPRLIEDWRARWQHTGLPFYFVQIAPHTYDGDRGEASELREAQALTLRLANTGMAVTTDIGDPRNIHPGDKRSVGDRLARLALARNYGRKDIVDEGPALLASQFKGARATLQIRNTEGGLQFEGGAPGPFYLAGEDQRFFAAVATIEGTKIILTSEFVAEPVAARFAWACDDAGNLANGAGLPAAPFRTDDWPSVTRGGRAFEARR